MARAEADARLREVGPNQAQLTVIPQRRHITSGPTYSEWEVDLSSPVRWPHKARLDHKIGAAGVQVARLLLADAHHTGARLLLMQWSNWQRAYAVAAQQHAQVAIWERDHKAIARRVELGDVAHRDLIAADAILAQAQAAALQADADARSAKLILHSDFPDLPLPQRAQLSEQPPELGSSTPHWSDLIVQRSHEIDAAVALVRQRAADAQRARADRLPDPTVGVRLLNELGGREHSVGLILGIPFGMRQRSARAAAASADALAARSELNRVRRDVTRDARNTVARARAAHAIWASYRQASQAARDSASKTGRAYTLGESGLTELLAARRTELEAALAERRAAVNANEAVARVRVDAHELWRHHVGGSDPGTHDAEAMRLP